MALTPKQLSMYRAEFGKVRALLRRLGVSPKEADAARMVLHKRAGVVYKDGTPKSSSDLTNADLTKVLGAFWQYICLPANRLEAQLRQTPTYQEAIMGRWSCERIYDMIREIAPEEIIRICNDQRQYFPADISEEDLSIEAVSANIDNIFYSQNGGRRLGGANPRTGSADQWHKVYLACVYRYDQIMRRLLDEQGSRYGTRYWPYNHLRNLDTLRAAGVLVTPPVMGFVSQPDPVYAGAKGDDPF